MNRRTTCCCIAGLLLLFGPTVVAADAEAETDAVEQDAGGPQALIAMDFWAVSLAASVEKAVDEAGRAEAEHLLARVGNLPTVVGQRGAVPALIARLENQGIVRRVRAYRLTSLGGHQAVQQSSESKPQITATSLTRGGVTNSVQYTQVGTVVQLTPVREADGWIQVNVKFDTSDLRASQAVPLVSPTEGKTQFASETASTHVETMVWLRSGQAVLVAAGPDESQSANGTHLFILSAAVVE